MTIYNRKGDPSGKQVYNISDVTTNGSTTSATINSEMFDKKGKTIAKGKSEIECNGGVMMVDVKMMLPQQQQEQFSKAEAKVDKAYIEYPVTMNAGDELKDASFHMNMEMNGGMKQEVTMLINNRKVEGKESITTPAGTWDCYKISYKAKLNIKTMGIGVPVNIDGTEWFAPGFGVVKTESSKGGGTEITSVK